MIIKRYARHLWRVCKKPLKILPNRQKTHENLIQINLENARLAGEGAYIGLLCPKCGTREVQAWFSKHKEKEKYGIWFECMACCNVEHINCGYNRPKGFMISRISEKFQKME